MLTYILNEQGEPVPCPDVLEWGAWFGDNDNRRLKRDEVGNVLVSTVFLGLDHSHGMDGPPVLWETMIFGSPAHNDYQERYCTREEALAGHAEALKLVLAR